MRQFLLAGLMVASACHAMEFKPQGDTLTASGPIHREDLDEFVQNLNGVKTVILRDSPGGDVDTALEVGYSIRERGINTIGAGYCYSACALMFLGGNQRTIQPNGLIGFHGAVAIDHSYIGMMNSRIIGYVRFLTNDKFPLDLANDVFRDMFEQDLLLVTKKSVDTYVRGIRRTTQLQALEIGVLTR